MPFAGNISLDVKYVLHRKGNSKQWPNSPVRLANASSAVAAALLRLIGSQKLKGTQFHVERPYPFKAGVDYFAWGKFRIAIAASQLEYVQFRVHFPKQVWGQFGAIATSNTVRRIFSRSLASAERTKRMCVPVSISLRLA